MPPHSGSLIRCTECGEHRLAGSTTRCRNCGTDTGEPVDASGPVTLHSFTEIHRTFPGFETPYVVGWVDHPAGVRMLVRINDAAAATLTLGAQLEMVDDGMSDDGIAYSCRPAAMANGAVG
ncbi:MAG TPA: OB-fold domain-containing protein [Mycobacteriales bacterium]|jgi:uncharacterized OB-fold protein|nr:OB-fold domain-containing protein [Mycobacteriales bacterium]